MERKSTKVLVTLCCILALVLTFSLSKLWQQSNIEQVSNEIEKKVVRTESTELVDSIHAYLNEKGIAEADVGLSIRSLDGYETYSINGDDEFIAASVYKLPLAMIWYEKVNNGEVSLEDTLYYDSYHYEEGPGVPLMYSPGANIPIQTLLETMIQLSDNTAGHILFENLGGWASFKEMAASYTDRVMDSLFFSNDNYLTANYMGDVIQYIVDHKDSFSKLISDMKISVPDNYLNLHLPESTAQKYGSFDKAENAAGFVEGSKIPYSIVVFTDLGVPGIEVIGDINQLCFEYFNKEA